MQWFCIVWLGLFPFIHQFSVYEGAKVVWLWSGGFILAIWWVLRLWSGEAFWLKSFHGWFLCWLGLVALSSLLGIHPIDSFVGGGYRHQGVLFFLTLFLIGQTVRRMTPMAKQWLVMVYAVGAMTESMLLLWQRYSLPSARPLGTLGEPNAAAGYLAFSIYWVVQCSFHWVWKSIALGILCLGIIATESRAGLGAAAVILGAYGWAVRARLLKQNRVGAATAVFWSIVGALSCSVVILAYIFATRPTSLYESRPLFWRMALKAIQERPVLGYGAESSEMVFYQTFTEQNIRLFDFVIERAHNIFLDVAMWSGLIGLGIFIVWIGSTWKHLREEKAILSRMAFVAWIVFACVQPLGVVHWVQMMVMVAMRRLK